MDNREPSGVIIDRLRTAALCERDHGLSEFGALVLNYALRRQDAANSGETLSKLEPHKIMEAMMTDADESLVAEKLACIYGDRLVGILKKAVEDLP